MAGLIIFVDLHLLDLPIFFVVKIELDPSALEECSLVCLDPQILSPSERSYDGGTSAENKLEPCTRSLTTQKR